MNRADIHELECFVAVAEELNFSRAAARLHMSQPPLSRQIQSLEEKLALRLFERSTRAVALTPAGELYLEDARDILTRLDAAAESARRAVGGEGARLRLAFIGALLDEGLVKLLQIFRASHPGCQIHLADLPAGAQLEALRAGQVDGAFIGAPVKNAGRDTTSVTWKREPLLLALPERHPFAASKTVPLARLKTESWVMISRNAAPAFRRQFDALCSGAGFRPRVVQESDRVAAVLTMVAAEQGISLLPEAVSRLIRTGVAFRPVKGEKLVLSHTFVYRTRNANPGAGGFCAVACRAGRRTQIIDIKKIAPTLEFHIFPEMNLPSSARAGTRHPVFHNHFTRIFCAALVALAAASCKQDSAAPTGAAQTRHCGKGRDARRAVLPR